MPKIENTMPAFLRPYDFHGMDLTIKGKHALSDCPFCSKEGKFSIDTETGQWRCFSCSAGSDKGGGNIYTFMRCLWQESLNATKEQDYEQLRDNRKLLGVGTLRSWGCCKSLITDEWIIPGYNVDLSPFKKRIINLYPYRQMNGRYTLTATTGQAHGLMLPDDFDPKKPKIFIAEGPWDGMTLWECLGDSQASIVSVAGCGAVGEPMKKFMHIFADKNVTMLFDSDHPREVNGKTIEGAGLQTSKRLTQIFSKAESSPSSLKWLQWGNDGFDPNKPKGYDVRDLLSSSEDRKLNLKELLAKISPIPESWLNGRSVHSSKNGKVEIECLPCNSWKDLVNSFRKALSWTEGMDKTLSVMLASVLSVRSIGDQLWIKVIGRAASGKSTLCEALSVNRKRVIAKSTIKGFHSGWKDLDGDNKSLILKIANKTLVIKDGDTILSSSNYEQILSEARDLYDTTARSDFKNGMGKDHEGIRATIILCGTAAIRKIDLSELGARFLDCVIMEDIDEDLEDEINLTILHRAKRNVSLVSDSHKQADTIDPDLLKAMQLTGGYIDHICNNAEELMPRPDDMSEKYDRQIIRYAKFIAYMRARPSLSQDETVEREFSGRLVSQLTRLAMCLVPARGAKKVNEDIMGIVRAITLDTARGRVLEICKHLYDAAEAGRELEYLMYVIKDTRDKTSPLMRFMGKIGIVEEFEVEGNGFSKSRKWRLTQKIFKL